MLVDDLNQEIKRMVDKTKPVKKAGLWSRMSATLRRRKPTNTGTVEYELK